MMWNASRAAGLRGRAGTPPRTAGRATCAGRAWSSRRARSPPRPPAPLGEHGEAAVGAVHVEPDPVRAADVGDLGERIDRARVRRARVRDRGEGLVPGGDVGLGSPRRAPRLGSGARSSTGTRCTCSSRKPSTRTARVNGRVPLAREVDDGALDRAPGTAPRARRRARSGSPASRPRRGSPRSAAASRATGGTSR